MPSARSDSSRVCEPFGGDAEVLRVARRADAVGDVAHDQQRPPRRPPRGGDPGDRAGLVSAVARASIGQSTRSGITRRSGPAGSPTWTTTRRASALASDLGRRALPASRRERRAERSYPIVIDAGGRPRRRSPCAPPATEHEWTLHPRRDHLRARNPRAAAGDVRERDPSRAMSGARWRDRSCRRAGGPVRRRAPQGMARRRSPTAVLDAEEAPADAAGAPHELGLHAGDRPTGPAARWDGR